MIPFTTTLLRHSKKFFLIDLIFFKIKSTVKPDLFQYFLGIFLINTFPWGGRGRRFKSGHSDQRKPTQFRGFFGIAWVFVLDGKIDTTLTTTHTKCSVENKNPAGYFLSVLHISSYFEYI